MAAVVLRAGQGHYTLAGPRDTTTASPLCRIQTWEKDDGVRVNEACRHHDASIMGVE